MAPSPSELAKAAETLRRQEFARLAEAVTPRIETFRSMTGDLFRNEIVRMLDRLGHTIVSTISDIVTIKAGQKFIVACAEPLDKTPTKIPAIRRLHDAVISGSAARGIYVTPREFSPEADHYAASAPIDLVDGALLIKSMHQSRKGLLVPTTYKAMCCQCGDIVQHQLDKNEARACCNGHAVVPTIARAALIPYRPDPSEQPAVTAQPKPGRMIRARNMSAKAQRRRKIKAHNNRLRARTLPAPRPRAH